jgi:MFS family permease
MSPKKFYGWWITVYAFLTFGLAVGIPYYGGPFFYDYYEKSFGWKRPDVTLGFPLAATLTLWVGPLLVHRFSPRKMIVIGTGCTALAFFGWSRMTGELWMYYALWGVYSFGYYFSGPIAHQVIISQWFRQHRGKAMAIVYLGVGVFGGISAKFIARPLTEAFGDFRMALAAFGGLMLLAWPLALFLMRDRPADIGQQPDGDAEELPETKAPPQSFSYLLRHRAFWLLVIGSAASIGAIGSINQHMKFVFKEQIFPGVKILDAGQQSQLDGLFGDATFAILFSSIAGRLFMGWLADRYNKKIVMSATYFIVAATIPLLFLVTSVRGPEVYLFSVLFGFAMGADYMLIPLMAAEQFGVNSLARAMSVILPTDTIGQTWFPFAIALIHDKFGGYSTALLTVFGMAAVGTAAILMLPKPVPRKSPVLEPTRAH